jgi:hypothetical protein
MAQRPAGIDLTGLVQNAPRPVAVSKSSRGKSAVPPARPWRIISPDEISSEKESGGSAEAKAVRNADSTLLAAVPSATRFREIDHQLGQLVSRWPKLPAEIRSAVMELIARDTLV